MRIKIFGNVKRFDWRSPKLRNMNIGDGLGIVKAEVSVVERGALLAIDLF